MRHSLRCVKTLLGFDYGKRRIGVAVGQTITGTATPIATVDNYHQQPDWTTISKLIDQWQPTAIIVGLPQTLDGTTHPLETNITAFCHSLHERYSISVFTIDESYSSTEAYQRLKSSRQAGRQRKIKKDDIDALAAVILLESWMDTPISEPRGD